MLIFIYNLIIINHLNLELTKENVLFQKNLAHWLAFIWLGTNEEALKFKKVDECTEKQLHSTIVDIVKKLACE